MCDDRRPESATVGAGERAYADLRVHIQRLFDTWPRPIDPELRDAVLEILVPEAGEANAGPAPTAQTEGEP